jgi:hypothetical protein
VTVAESGIAARPTTPRLWREPDQVTGVIVEAPAHPKRGVILTRLAVIAVIRAAAIIAGLSVGMLVGATISGILT